DNGGRSGCRACPRSLAASGRPPPRAAPARPGRAFLQNPPSSFTRSRVNLVHLRAPVRPATRGARLVRSAVVGTLGFAWRAQGWAMAIERPGLVDGHAYEGRDQD